MRNGTLALLMGFSFLLGCPEGGDDVGADTGTTNGDGDGDNSGDGDGDGDNSGDGDGDDSGKGSECDGFGAIESDKTILFSVTNESQVPRYIVTAGDQCPVYGLELETDDTYETITNHSWWTFPCGGPGGPGPNPEKLRLIEPGATIELGWDGRRIAACNYGVYCSELEEWSGDVQFAQQPLDAGEYRITLSYFETLPIDCMDEDDDGEYVCSDNETILGPAACGGDGSASTEITVAEGDIAAQVILP